MENINRIILVVIVTTLLAGCAGVKRQVAEMEARGTIEAGGYTWKIRADSEGGNSIQTRGLPGRQAATDASNQLCKKHGRISQFVDRKGLLFTGLAIFNFNCVR